MKIIHHIKYVLIFIILMSCLISVTHTFPLSNVEGFKDYADTSHLSGSQMLVYNDKITQITNPEYYTPTEIVNKPIEWLNREDELDRTEVFGHNKFNEPIRFISQQSNSITYVTPQFYRAQRWCEDGKNCPKKSTPLLDFDSPKWTNLVDLSQDELNDRFYQTYKNKENYYEMFDAFQYFSRDNGASYFANNSNPTYSNHLANADHMSEVYNTVNNSSFKTDMFKDDSRWDSQYDDNNSSQSTNWNSQYKNSNSSLRSGNDTPPCNNMFYDSNKQNSKTSWEIFNQNFHQPISGANCKRVCVF